MPSFSPSHMPSTSTGFIDQLRLGQSQAWSTLSRNYGRLVIFWCRRRNNLSWEDTEEVLQEVLKAVFTNIANFRKDRNVGTFRGWLKTITDNKIRDLLRRRRGRAQAAGGSDAQHFLDQLPAPWAAVTDRSLHDETSVSEDDDQQDLAFLLRTLLDAARHHFSEKSWTAFWMAEVEGRPRREVADELGMTVQAVNQVIYRIRRWLRKQIDGLLD